MRFRSVAILSLVFTYVFFAAYLSPFRKVHIPFDLEGYHYPLLDYAFQGVASGRLPLWDAAIYCGQTLAGNIQAALFYPGTWVLFAANIFRRRLTFQGVQMFELAHVWLGFLLSYLWFSRRKLSSLASALGAGVFAYSGYMCLQLQHQGLVTSMAWFPLGFLGIDEANDSRSVRPLWKLAVASSFVFLAGYPPQWAIFALCAGAYAVARIGQWRWLALGSASALLLSLALSAMQLLPSMEATKWMLIDARYGLGLKDPWFYLSYVVPNYWAFGMHMPVDTNFGRDYFYLGAVGLFGLGAWFTARRWRESAPLLGMLLVSVIGLTNPWNLVWSSIQNSEMLGSVLRSWYFIAGVSVALSGLAAIGIDAFLARSGRFYRPLLALAGLYLGYSLAVEPVAGWASAIDTVAGITIVCVLLCGVRASSGRTRQIAAAAVLLCAGVEYRRFGAAKRFNADKGPGLYYSREKFDGIDPVAYRQMQSEPSYRIAIGEGLIIPVMLRHSGLATPQGFDPFMSRQYRDYITSKFKMRSDREFEIPADRVDVLKALGVGYYVTSDSRPEYAAIAASPNYREIGEPSYYRVFELVDKQPPYRFDGPVEKLAWLPETRRFKVQSQGGRFVLAEQYFPGWRATIDGQEFPNQQWEGLFQSVIVPAGEHTVEFSYRPDSVKQGIQISAASWLALGVLLLVRKK